MPQPKSAPIVFDIWTENGLLKLGADEIDLILMSCCENFLSRQHQSYIIALLKAWSEIACEPSKTWQVQPVTLGLTRDVIRLRTPPPQSPHRAKYERLFQKLSLQPPAKPKKAP